MSPFLTIPDRIVVAALIVAAGRGLRVGIDLPKQYLELDGETVLARSIRALAADARVKSIICVIHPDDLAHYNSAVASLPIEIARRLLEPAFGGITRQASGHAGLEALATGPNRPDLVLVHDAARPFTSEALVRRSIEAAYAKGAAIPGVSVTDTIKRVDAQGQITDTPTRRDLKAVQTPQAFRFDLLLKAHRAAASKKSIDFTDDAAVAEWAGHPVYVFDGELANSKLTTLEDFEASRATYGLTGNTMASNETRTGIGYDVHAFAEGDAVILGGFTLPHTHRLSGHSDADVVLHAITDAIFGALADGDIGSHFPPSDPQWKGAASRIFLECAVEKVKARGGKIVHLDTTIICEAPKIGPHRDAIRESIAAICGLRPDRVGVKATTTEQLGFTGRREGIAAQAIATISLPAVTD